MKTIAFFLLFICCTTLIYCKRKVNETERIQYYDSGDIKSIKRYKGGKLEGESIWFYPNGTVEQKIVYKNDLANGNAHYFYESGALKSHRFFRDNKRVGYVADYFDDSVAIIQSILLYNNNGQLAYRKSFDSTGNLISEEGKKP